MPVTPRRPPVRFGVFEFDLVTGDLWKAGRRIRLQNQPRQVLRVLVSRADDLVTRDELRRELWPDDTFVDFDNGLNVAIRKIREALDDEAPSPRFVQTERAQGYRFIAPVRDRGVPSDGATTARFDSPAHDERVAPADHSGPGAAALPAEHAAHVLLPEPVAPPKRLRPLLVLAFVVAVATLAGVWAWRTGAPVRAPSEAGEAAPIVLAVLPFGTSGGESEDFLAIGIPDGIITRLSNVRQFRVRPTGAVIHYRGQEVDAREVGQRLASQYVLMGSVRATADRVRVGVQLVRTEDGSPVWGRQYDRARADLLGVEDAVADEIVGALQIQISDAERERVYRRYTRNAAAYERYLDGRARLSALTDQGTRQAIAAFEEARSHDPEYALAYAGLATAAAQLHVRFGADAAWDTRARHEARRALELDPRLAEAHEALAAVQRFQEFDWEAVIRESRRALELNPSLDMPHLHLASAYFHLGLLEESEFEARQALVLNPEGRLPWEILGAVALWSGRYEDAIIHLSRVQEASDSRIVSYLVGLALYYRGERWRAEAQLETLIADEGPLAENARASLAALRAARHATDEARALAARVASDANLNHHAAYGLGAAYAQLLDGEAAVRWLSQAAATGFPCYPWYERDPLLDPIRDDARFVDFMRGLRLTWEGARASAVGGRP